MDGFVIFAGVSALVLAYMRNDQLTARSASELSEDDPRDSH